MLFMVSFHTID